MTLWHGRFTEGPADELVPDVRDQAYVFAKTSLEEAGFAWRVTGGVQGYAANKVDGVRCALAWSEQTATLGRQHNNANVVSVGGRMHTAEEATRFVELFLETPFSEDPRHQRRIDLLTRYESER